MVLVSHQHQFVFLKTKKTASSTIESFLEPFCRPESGDGSVADGREYISDTGIVGAPAEFVTPDVVCWNHMPAADVRRQRGRKIWRRYLRLASMRNPFDKPVSLFHFRKGAPPPDATPVETLRAEFRAWLLARARSEFDLPVYKIWGRSVIDDFIRQETVSEDLSRVCRRLGLPFDPDRIENLKVRRDAGASHYAVYYDPDTRRLVERRFRWEMLTFGYQFEDEPEARCGPTT